MEPPEILIIGSYVQDLTWNTQAFPAPGETVIGTFQTGLGVKALTKPLQREEQVLAYYMREQ